MTFLAGFIIGLVAGIILMLVVAMELSAFKASRDKRSGETPGVPQLYLHGKDQQVLTLLAATEWMGGYDFIKQGREKYRRRWYKLGPA